MNKVILIIGGLFLIVSLLTVSGCEEKSLIEEQVHEQEMKYEEERDQTDY